ncbi:uncharacterized protein LOC136078356 [Hydra vulgaris]|uniref:Uncharacterized protein LOC136078356 n=1 Tax=Hydra vulgaris TaxID=6087 RepID=A0ABM4BM26_HYDVU
MERCSRTQRRKVQKIVSTLLTNLSQDNLMNEEVILNNGIETISTHGSHVSCNWGDEITEIELPQNACTEIPSYGTCSTLNNDFVYNELTEFSNDSDNESSSSLLSSDDYNIQEELQQWITEFNVSHRAVNALLKIFQNVGVHVPKDARTLLKTPSSVVQKVVAGGVYYHVGVENAIRKLLQTKKLPADCLNLRLNININGLPLFRSSNVQLWPILGSIIEVSLNDVFIIGLYSGITKPSSLFDYLNDFVTEMKQLGVEGIHFIDKHYKVTINAVICDAPARAFIKCIKGHCGYNACERCTQEGVYCSNKMTFPKLDAPLRTNEDFLAQKDEEHHTSNMVSPLTELNIGMVSHFPLDYMHLVCLGVVRRMICLWIKGEFHCRQSSNTISITSANLCSLREAMPSDFCRRPRPLFEFRKWKATELRQFLLYSGAVVLHNVLPQLMYQNFLTLSIAMILLLCPRYAACEHYRDYAEKLMINFVQNFRIIYGDNQLVYNVHTLIHLVQDCRIYGALDNVSAFPFENKLGIIKKLIRKPHNPIAQVINRCEEKAFATLQNRKSMSVEQGAAKLLQRKHSTGMMPPNLPSGYYQQYKNYNGKKYFVSISLRDSCFKIHGMLSFVKKYNSIK